jgi:hypothetical protein
MFKKIAIIVMALCFVSTFAFADNNNENRGDSGKINVFGVAAQGSIAKTELGFGHHSETEGFAAQGSVGLYGGSLTPSSNDNRDRGKEQKNEVGIEMEGSTYSYSYVDRDCHGITKGTEVGAETEVESFAPAKQESSRDSRERDRNEGVNGGYIAGGIVATQTIDKGAYAGAAGGYVGAGGLGSNFNGSASGYSQTQTYSNHGSSSVGSFSGASAEAKSSTK